MTTVVVHSGREKPLQAGHPWLFSGAIQHIEGQPAPGSLVRVVTADAKPLGIGYINPRCSITVRMLTRTNECDEQHIPFLNPDLGPDWIFRFLKKRLKDAFSLRQAILQPGTTSYRLINGEGDFLPGCIVDVYGPYLVCQHLTAGAELLKPVLIQVLTEMLKPRGIYEKSAGGVRKEEGLSNTTGLLWGEEPPPLVEIHQNSCRFLVDLRGGQKTGFFLDQRDNRALVAHLAQGKTVLNGFSYTGAFGVVAAKYGARQVTSVDSSKPSLSIAQKNFDINHLSSGSNIFLNADMFTFLREQSESFDLIILDPPSFIRRRHDKKAGVKGYRDINVQAFQRLRPGGQMLTFSCSQHLSREDFSRLILFAAAESGHKVRVIKHLGQSNDHPLNAVHPEGAYLKGLWMQVGD